jgi:hypothetical protein
MALGIGWLHHAAARCLRRQFVIGSNGAFRMARAHRSTLRMEDAHPRGA